MAKRWNENIYSVKRQQLKCNARGNLFKYGTQLKVFWGPNALQWLVGTTTFEDDK